jgi:hypothetical protein
MSRCASKNYRCDESQIADAARSPPGNRCVMDTKKAAGSILTSSDPTEKNIPGCATIQGRQHIM